MMHFPRTKNGWADSGKAIGDQVCFNCGSKAYQQTISSEYCPDCGLSCDYWGDGANSVYEEAMEKYSTNFIDAE